MSTRRGLIRRPPVLLTSERTGQLAPATGYDGDRRLKDGKLRPAEKSIPSYFFFDSRAREIERNVGIR